MAELSTGISDVAKLLPTLSTPIKYNPTAIIKAALSSLKNKNIVDPTNPFFALLDSASVLAANAIVESEINLRKTYPSLAQNEEEIYSHMSDRDFIDRFATPSKSKISLFILKDELDQSLVYDNSLNLEKLTIPRNTQITIDNYDFSLIYPIDIIRYSHGGYEVKYRFDVESPISLLTTNKVFWEWRTLTNNTDKWLYLEMDVYQFSVVSFNGDINTTTGFIKTYDFKDQFYLARVFTKGNLTGSQWVELKTTHSEMVYEPKTITAVLKVINNNLTVMIPQIYISDNLISGSIRVDIYETKGFINLDLSNFDTSRYLANWKLLDSNESNQFSYNLNNIRNLLLYSNKTVYGGKNSLTFDELKQRVIDHSVGDIKYPITNVQISNIMENDGYEIVKDIDVVTNRIFLANKNLPEPNVPELITRANASIETIVFTIDELIYFDKTYSEITQTGTFVKPNKNLFRVTLCPGLIFNNQNGLITIFKDQFISNYRDLNDPNNFLNKIRLSKENNFLYLPFHYVLDYNKNEFECRPYQLDNPTVSSIYFLSQLETVNYQTTLGPTSIEYKDDHYLFRVKTFSNTFYKNLSPTRKKFVLSFIPDDDVNETKIIEQFFTVDLNDGENIISFKLETNLDIDSNNYLYFTNFSSSTESKSKLNQKFNLDFLVDDVVITKTEIGLEFGKYLKNLWSRSRTIVSHDIYEKYPSDIPLTYEEDVYKKDIITGSIYTFDAAGNLLQPVLLHKKGDIVYDDNGIKFKHRAGDVIIDDLGKPKLIKETSIARQLELFFIDGVYFLADDFAAKKYKDQIIKTLVDQITIELENITSKLLEQTKIYFYPKCSMGKVKVLADKNTQLFIDAQQSFEIDLYVKEHVFNSHEFQEEIKKTTINVLDKLLKNKTISVSEINYELKKIFSNSILDIDIKGLGENKNLRAISLLNNEDSFSIKKVIKNLQNKTTIVEEDIKINFFSHNLKT